MVFCPWRWVHRAHGPWPAPAHRHGARQNWDLKSPYSPKFTSFSLHGNQLFIIYYVPHTALWTIDSTLNKILSLSLKDSHSRRGLIKVIIMILSNKCLKCILRVHGEGTISPAWGGTHLLDSHRSDLKGDGPWKISIHQAKVERCREQRKESKSRKLEGRVQIHRFTGWEWSLEFAKGAEDAVMLS